MNVVLPWKEYISKLYRLPVAACALIFDQDGRVLLLKPTYREGYMAPGGSLDAGESPRVGLTREIREEVGLDLKPGVILCLEYTHKNEGADYDDARMMLVFDCGTISDDQKRQIRLSDEHSEFGFFEFDEALKVAGLSLAQRLPACLEAKRTGWVVYLEDGVMV